MENRFRVIYFISSKKLIRLKCYDDEQFTRFNSSTFVVWREQLKLINEQVRNFFEKKCKKQRVGWNARGFYHSLSTSSKFPTVMTVWACLSNRWMRWKGTALNGKRAFHHLYPDPRLVENINRPKKKQNSSSGNLRFHSRTMYWHYRQHVNLTWKRLISVWRWYEVSFSFSFSFVRVLRRTRGQEHAAESESESFVATKARGSLLRWQGRAMAGSRSSGIEKQSRNEDSCSCPLVRGTSQLQAFWRSPRYIPGDWDFEIPDTTLLHDRVTIRRKRSEVFIEKKGV